MKAKKPTERQKLRIRTGDEVVVLSGAGSKDKTPKKVTAVDARTGRVTVEGVNIQKDRKRANRGGYGQQSEIVEREASIHASNVALYDAKSKKPTRVKITTDGDGRRVRTSTRSGEKI